MSLDLKLMFSISVTETSLTDVDNTLNVETGCIFIQSELKFSRQYYKVWEEIENKSEELRYKIHVFQNNEGESYYEDEDCYGKKLTFIRAGVLAEILNKEEMRNKWDEGIKSFVGTIEPRTFIILYWE